RLSLMQVSLRILRNRFPPAPSTNGFDTLIARYKHIVMYEQSFERNLNISSIRLEPTVWRYGSGYKGLPSAQCTHGSRSSAPEGAPSSPSSDSHIARSRRR